MNTETGEIRGEGLLLEELGLGRKPGMTQREKDAAIIKAGWMPIHRDQPVTLWDGVRGVVIGRFVVKQVRPGRVLLTLIGRDEYDERLKAAKAGG